MLDATQTDDGVFIKSAPDSQPRASLSSVEVMVIPPPPSSLMACADGLRMELLGTGSSVKNNTHAYEMEPCRCHEAVEKYLEQQSQAVPVLGSCASVDELTESDSAGVLTLDSLSTCGAPTCLLFHCLGFKIRGQIWPDAAAPMHIAPSRINPAFVASEQAERDRLEAVQAAQSSSHVQVSDVTLALMDQMKTDWDNDSD